MWVLSTTERLRFVKDSIMTTRKPNVTFQLDCLPTITAGMVEAVEAKAAVAPNTALSLAAHSMSCCALSSSSPSGRCGRASPANTQRGARNVPLASPGCAMQRSSPTAPSSALMASRENAPSAAAAAQRPRSSPPRCTVVACMSRAPPYHSVEAEMVVAYLNESAVHRRCKTRYG
jgi:hypothetical protein